MPISLKRDPQSTSGPQSKPCTFTELPQLSPLISGTMPPVTCDTPGSALRSRSTWLSSTAVRALSYPARRGTTRNVEMPSTVTPRFTRLTFISDFRKSALMMSRPMESEICTVTSDARNRAAARPPVS